VIRKLLNNHVLTNLSFLLVVVMGSLAYLDLPREQDPSINFNWVQIWTFWPGATATDVEQQVTEPLEEGIEKVRDIRFVSSTSREGVSSILVRFNDLDSDDFDKRVSDLRQEIQSQMDELPEDTEQPDILEISSANAFPTATLVVTSLRSEESLHSAARAIQKDIQRFEGVDSVAAAGARDPELQVDFHPERLQGLGIAPVVLADTVRAYFRDLAAGNIAVGDREWLARLDGSSTDVELLGSYPLLSAVGEVPLDSVATVRRGRADPADIVRHDGQTAVMLSVFKAERANNIDVVEQLMDYIEGRNRLTSSTGISVALIDDQTQATRMAIDVMERNALFGLLFVLFTVWLFLGFRIALLTGIGIPFVLAGTFWVLNAAGQTLNLTVLLGVVISLGMLVDDAVVIVEAIHEQLKRGRTGFEAIKAAFSAVGRPVVTAVLTTIAAFLPLMLLPGVLGDFMRVVPIVVSTALLLSLVEVFWMLPAHVLQFGAEPGAGRLPALRRRIIRRMGNAFGRSLVFAVRRPWLPAVLTTAMAGGAAALLFMGAIKIDFFASDVYRLFYVNVEMPAGTRLEKTSSTLESLKDVIEEHLDGHEIRGIVHYAGQQFTDSELLIGADKGQVFVSLYPARPGDRSVIEIMDSLRQPLLTVPGPVDVSLMRRKTGPPTAKPVSLKLRGNDIDEIRAAAEAVKAAMQTVPGVHDISDDDSRGGQMLSLRLNADAITRSKLNPADVARTIRLFADGEVVASLHNEGEKVEVRVRARPAPLQDIQHFLNYPLGLADGGNVPLSALVHVETQSAVGNIRHQDFRRAVTIDADIVPEVTDTLAANRQIADHWETLAPRYPGVSIDYSGELDDIQQSLGDLAALFVLGMGLIYLILGTQFRSYTLPLLVLATVPMALLGVVFGLLVSDNPMSLFTLYGTIALAGIATNDTIVLISAANDYRARRMPVATAIVLAARRRFLPILITTVTTIAGLFSLAVGLGGESLMWGPVATAIVWGLGVSTLLTLYVTPLLYRLAAHPGGDETPGLSLPGGKMQEAFSGSGILHRLMGLGNEQAKILRDALTSETMAEAFGEGVEALRDGDAECAIKRFQSLADARPDVFAFNLHAAQANVLLMQRIGWDVGYMARAERYLRRAESTDPNDRRTSQLRAAMRSLQKQDE
jgi:multidrug efflux pump subunit AcrB